MENREVTRARILVVDDTLDNLEMMEEILTVEGYDVELAHNGHEALEIIKLSPPDLLLLDFMMPEMNGYEVTLRLQKSQVQFPILWVTGFDEGRELAKELGVDVLLKPIRLHKLLAKVQSFLPCP